MNRQIEPCAGDAQRAFQDPASFDGASVRKGTQVHKSRMGRRRAWVLLAVHVAVFAHILQWQLSGTTLTPMEPSEAMYSLATGVINAGALLFGLTILTTFVLGRFFCGWACHLVALQDACGWLMKKAGIRPRPLRSRALMWVPLAAGLYMFAWPVVSRLLRGETEPRIKFGLETSAFWQTFPGFWIGLATFLVCGFAIVYLLGAKGFCTYACPYGGIFGVADKLAPGRIRVTDACKACGHCTAVCTSNVSVDQEVHRFGMVVNPGCMKCMDCVSACPEHALYFGFGRPAVLRRARRPGQGGRVRQFLFGEEAALALVFLAALLSFHGLYGEVPFLFSLALAAITAFLAITAFRMIAKAEVRFGRWALKRGGRWGRAGILLVALSILWFGFTIHSGLIQWHMWRAGVLVESTAPASVAAWTQDPDALAAVQEEVRASVSGARAHFDDAEALGLVPDVRIIRQRAWLALVEGRLSEAERLLRQAIALTPGFDSSRSHLGRVLLLKGDTEGAIAAFREAIRLGGHRPEYREQLGLALERAGRDEQALEILASVAVEYPERGPARTRLAGLLHKSGRSEEASGILRALLEDQPGDLAARAQLAGILAESGRAAEARAELQRILDAQPENTEARFQAATLLYLGGDTPGGIAALEAAWTRASDAERERLGRQIAVNPEVGRALLGVGLSLLGRGEREHAILALKVLWEAWPDDPALAFPYAQALLGARRYAETEAVAARTLEAAPDDRRLLHLQGLALFLLERPTEAAEVLERAAALDPENPDLWAHLAEALIAAGRRERARAVLARALEAAPDHPGLLRLKPLLEDGSPRDPDQG